MPTECCSQDSVGDVAQCMAEFQQQNGFGVFHDACLAVERYVASCEKAVSNFDGASYKEQASCLCYDDNNNYDPDTWDNAVATCVSTGQSAHPTIWSALEKDSGVIGLCTKFADGAAATGPATSGPATTGPATTGPVPTDAPNTATGDVSPGSTAGGDSPTPTETGSAVSSPTSSSKQSSTATRSSAAAATTSSAAAPSVGEVRHLDLIRHCKMIKQYTNLGLAIDGLCSHEVDGCRPRTCTARVYGDAVGGSWLGNTRSLASGWVND